MMALANFHFLQPWWLLAVLLLPCWLGMASTKPQRRRVGQLVDAHLLPHLIEQAPAHRHNAAAWLAAMAWMIACLALAGPAWEREPMPLFRNDAARILAIELSPTMLAGDVKPTRAERARFKINDILEASRDRETALIGYAGDAFVAAPADQRREHRAQSRRRDGSGNHAGGWQCARTRDCRSTTPAGAGRIQAWRTDPAGRQQQRKGRVRRASCILGRVARVRARCRNERGAPVPLPQGGFLQDANGNIVLPRLAQAELEQLASAGGGRCVTLGNDRHDIDVLLGGIDLGKAQASDSARHALSERFRDRGPWLVLLLLPWLCSRFVADG